MTEDRRRKADADEASGRPDRAKGSATYRSRSLERRGPTRAVRLSCTALALLLLLTPAASRQLTAVRVAEGQNLQAAINAATPGDVILLAPGARFVGNFVLPRRAETETPSFVTIRTDGAGLPGPGIRTGSGYAGRLAILQSGNNTPALRTAPGAHHWRIENVEFRGNAGGYGDIIALGHGTNQRRLEEVPHAIVLDRVYVHGDPLIGQKRAIALNSAATEIVNSYIADIKAVGQDSQAIAGWNGPGPFTIVNNYLEAAAENVLFGGADPAIPDLVPQDIVIRRNHITRPVEWRDPIVATPAAPVMSGSAPSSDPPGTSAARGSNPDPAGRSYRVVAERAVGGGQRALSLPGEPLAVGGDGAAKVAIEWPPVPDATAYRVYRRDGTGEQWWAVKEPRFTDDGTPGKPGAPPRAGSRWSVKNLLELKNARNVEIDGNVIEFNWQAAQGGYAILLKPVNQNGRAPWVTIENIRVTNNVVRHVAGAINISGIDTARPSARARDIAIRNNLFLDVSGERWGGDGDFMQIGNAPAGIAVENNTVVNDGRIINAYRGPGGEASSAFVFRGNVVRHNKYGVKGQSTAVGLPTLERYFPAATFERNVIGGAGRVRYPDGNRLVETDEIREDSTFPDAGADIGAVEKAVGAAKPFAVRDR